MIFLSW